MKDFQRLYKDQNSLPQGFGFVQIKYGKEETLKLFELAEEGNAEAQLELARIFLDETAPEYAFDWLVKASEQGNSEAYYYLWLIYRGEYDGFEADYQKADKILEIALNLKEPKAYLHLGDIYSDEEYEEYDLNRAFAYYMESAELGNYDAMETVGTCYLDGKGVEQSDSEAFKWFSLSHKGNYGYNLAHCYLDGIGTKKDIEKGVWWLEQIFEKKGDCFVFAEQELVDLYKAGYGGNDRNDKMKKVQAHIDEGIDLLMELFSEEELVAAREEKEKQEEAIQDVKKERAQLNAVMEQVQELQSENYKLRKDYFSVGGPFAELRKKRIKQKITNNEQQITNLLNTMCK